MKPIRFNRKRGLPAWPLYSITSLFDWREIENLGDSDRLRLVLEYMPDEYLVRQMETERRTDEMIIR